jgi:GT2 family glycosyltransferase
MIAPGEPPTESVATLQSLQDQTSENWTLTVVLHANWQTTFTSMVAVSGLQRSSKRVRVVCTDDSWSYDKMVPVALHARAGTDVAFIFPGDVWRTDAVAHLAAALSPNDVVYADEDVQTDRLQFKDPHLKPAYSPEFLLRSSYIGRPIAIGADVIQNMLGHESTETHDIEHDLALRACDTAHNVHHISEVLCHRLIASNSESFDMRPVVTALARRGETAEVTREKGSRTFTVTRTPPRGVLSSIVIPFRDEPRFLRTCVDSIQWTTTPGAVEFILVNNGSRQDETFTLLDQLRERPNVKILDDDRPFNWAQLNNAAVRSATGDIFIFLNNDMEATKAGWHEAIQAQVMRPQVGVVGARLLYPDRRLQHCGVVLGLGGAAGHIFVGLHENQASYLDMATTTRECSAVTGACLATRRDVFEKLDGFDDSLGIDLNDIDFCLRVRWAGLDVVCESQAELIHYESPSRGTAGDVRDIIRFIDRWKDSIAAGDPYLNPMLTRVDPSCALRRPDENQWWRDWHAGLYNP